MDAIPFDFRLTCRKGLDALLLAAPVMLGLLLLARRAAGALVEPLPLVGWLLTGLIMALWLRWSATSLPARFVTPVVARLPTAWLSLAIAGLLGLALWLPGTQWPALACYVAIVVVSGTLPVTLPWRRMWPAQLGHDLPWQFEGLSADSIGEETAATSSLAPAVVQKLTRRRDPGEPESLRGSLRADFVAGQRTASAHVAICPPFVGQPHCQVAVASGPAAEVRVASALPFGVRFEIKLAQATLEPASVVIEFAVDSTDGEIS